MIKGSGLEEIAESLGRTSQCKNPCELEISKVSHENIE